MCECVDCDDGSRHVCAGCVAEIDKLRAENRRLHAVIDAKNRTIQSSVEDFAEECRKIEAERDKLQAELASIHSGAPAEALFADAVRAELKAARAACEEHRLGHAEWEQEAHRLQAEVEKLKAERDELKSELDRIRSLGPNEALFADALRIELKRVEAERDGLEAERDGLEAEVKRLNAIIEGKNRTIQSSVDDFAAECRKIEAERDKLQAELASIHSGAPAEALFADAVREDLKRVEAERDAALEVLRELEWPICERSTGWYYCKICHGWQPFTGCNDDRNNSGHAKDCRLAALLREKP